MNTQNSAKNLVAGTIAVIAIILSIVSIGKERQILVNVPNSATQQLGAVPNLESSDAKRTCNGGLCTDFVRNGMNQASTTVCTLNTPAVDSQLVNNAVGVKFIGVATTTSFQLTIASSTAFSVATTTVFSQFAYQANSISNIIYYSTSTASTNDGIFKANSRINVSMTSLSTVTGLSTYSPSGFCSATFREI